MHTGVLTSMYNNLPVENFQAFGVLYATCCRKYTKPQGRLFGNPIECKRKKGYTVIAMNYSIENISKLS